MLRKIRIALATVMFIGITLLFVGIGQQWWGWMAKIQFLPSCFALNLGVIAGITVITLLLGRVYCSVVCPLGILQDSINWLSSRRKGKKARFHFHKELRWLRDAMLLLLMVAVIADIQWIISLLAPYSAYGRMVTTIVSPHSWVVAVVVAVTFVLIFLFAWLGGREYCSSVCPVGTVLSLFSRFSLFRPVIDKDKCVHCGLCEKKCKASCLSATYQDIDYSRCIDCFDCIDNCKAGAIKYKFAYGKKKNAPAKEESAGPGRRAFLVGTALVGASALASANDGGLAPVIDKQSPQRSCRIVPFGAGSVKDFYDRCTACQLCVTVCPNDVLRPSTDLQHFMEPEMGYEKGYCRPECTKCSEVCPTEAIVEITPEQKSSISIGVAKVDLDLCVVGRDGVNCGNCSRHCPVGAVRMVRKDPSDENSLLIPTVIEARCIGCGACENLCPSRPISAIHVDGLSVHQAR